MPPLFPSSDSPGGKKCTTQSSFQFAYLFPGFRHPGSTFFQGIVSESCEQVRPAALGGERPLNCRGLGGFPTYVNSFRWSYYFVKHMREKVGERPPRHSAVQKGWVNFDYSWDATLCCQRWRSAKNLPASSGDTRDAVPIPGSGRSLGEGNGNLLQHSCLENPIDRGAWWATVHRVTKSWAELSD